jgi:selenocysteine lyase/cysteine desulfurase
MAAPLIDRRRFLARGGLAVAASGVALAGCVTTGDAPPPTDSPSPVGTPTAPASPAAPSASPSPSTADLTTWEGVREQFALDPDLGHFAAFLLASHPASVRAAIDAWRQALDVDTAGAIHDDVEHENAVRAAAADYLGVLAEEVALTDSTTMGLGLTYGGLRLHPGDHVLTSTHDFYSTHESLRLAAERSGARVERIALYDDPAAASDQEIVHRVLAAVRRSTRAIALTWVHSSTGVKIPAARIGEALAAVNADRPPEERALFCLDAIHALGVEDVDPPDLGCDVFVSGTHKWLFGPRGTGIVWVRVDAWDRFAPIIPTFNGPSIGSWLTGERGPFIFGLDATPGGFHSFEHRWALAEAFAFHAAVGRARVADRTREQANQLKEGLAGLPGVRVVTPRDPEMSAGLVCCDVGGREPGEVVGELRDAGIVASVTPYREPFVRFGPSLVTSPEQVDGLVAAVAALA